MVFVTIFVTLNLGPLVDFRLREIARHIGRVYERAEISSESGIVAYRGVARAKHAHGCSFPDGRGYRIMSTAGTG